jgi:hypothetical protein
MLENEDVEKIRMKSIHSRFWTKALVVAFMFKDT